MKTKDLIKLLQEADPEGETECCIGNADIHFVEKLPAYYDGTLQVLLRDHSKDPYYNICGAKYTSQGSKIQIRSLSITDAIANDKELPIDYSEMGNKDKAKAYEEANNRTRQAEADIENNVELWLFTEWAKQQAHDIAGDIDTLAENASAYYHNNLKRSDPIPKDISEQTKEDKYGKSSLSYRDMRFMQWTGSINLEFDGFDWKLSKKE